VAVDHQQVERFAIPALIDSQKTGIGDDGIGHATIIAPAGTAVNACSLPNPCCRKHVR
jgi:hypothetical protein